MVTDEDLVLETSLVCLEFFLQESKSKEESMKRQNDDVVLQKQVVSIHNSNNKLQ